MYKEILAAAPVSMLEPEIERDLRRFVDNVNPVGSSGH
jgi:hypothetical protein